VSSILNSLAMGVLLASFVWAQQPQEIPAAPVPGQIASAKKIFISNAGEETIFRLPKDVLFRGGPNRAYNQFYAAMKSWGRHELVSAPADADLVFEIGFMDRNAGPVFVCQFKLVILDPKTGMALWTITKYVALAGMAKNREKNYDAAMMDLMEDVKSIVTPAASAASN
jgi:hypothetical protein